MSGTDSRPLNFYRLPVYQKQRVIGIENHQTNFHNRSPSPNRSIFASRRRHSTPPGAAKYFVDLNSPKPNQLIKYYHSYPRRGCAPNEHSPISESPSRPIPFIKFRHQEERGVRIVTTPTSIKSFTDVLLPLAKKNRNAIIETSATNLTEIQSISQSQSSAKRGRKASLNPERDVFLSNEETHDGTLPDDVCLRI
jgi:hypothetical protein